MVDEHIPVIDCHHHVGVADRSTWRSRAWRRSDLAERREFMAANDIDQCMILPTPTMTLEHTNALYSSVNTMVATYRDEAPDVVVAACCAVNPLVTRTALPELTRCFTELAMDGVAFHHRFLGTGINHDSMVPVLELAAEHSKVVAVHIIAESRLESPWRLFSLARRFPTVRFLALDGFSSPDQAAYLRDVAPDHPNVWFDTAVAVSVAHGFAEFIEACGPDRLVIGTDRYSSYPTFYRAFPVIELAAMGLPRGDLEKVFNGNLRSLLRLGS